MSVYRCTMCDQTKDADFSGCNEGEVCDSCQEYACYYCEKADTETLYCKITDQFYHAKCV